MRRPRLTFALLYFAEGAPIGFLWWTLPAALRADGVELDRIGGLLALLAIPWALKFLWAPLIDVARGPRWTTRHWVIAAQCVMAAALVPFVWLDPTDWIGPWSALFVVHAFAAATQDVAIDALAIRSVTPSEQGALNAWMQAGMLAGRSLFGGAALVLRARVGDPAVVAALVGAIVIAGGAVLTLSPDADRRRASFSEFSSAVLRVARDRRTWMGLGFAATAGAGFEFIGAFAGTWLIDLGASEERVGIFIAVAAVASTLLGGFVGGRLVDRSPRPRSLAGLVALSAAAAVVAGLVDFVAAGAPAAMAALVGVYLTLGALTTATYAHFMRLTSPDLGATQFSAFMGATNACESWAVWSGGRIMQRSSFGAAATTMALVSLASVAWLFTPRTVSREREG